MEPHRVIIKGITFLVFNYSKTIYIGNLRNSIEIKDLEDFIKFLDKCIKIIPTSNSKSNNDLTTILEKYEEYLKKHSNGVKNLQRKIKTYDAKIEELRYDL